MGRVIAIDFDEVCAQTFAAMIAVINAKYGKTLKVEDLVTNWLYYTPGFGGPSNVRRLQELNGLWVDHDAYSLQPVAGVRDALVELAERGWEVHIVTSRGPGGRVYLDPFFEQLGLAVGPDKFIKGLRFTGTDPVKAEAGAEPPVGSTPFPTTTEELVVDMERDARIIGGNVRDWRQGQQGKAKLKVRGTCAGHKLGADVEVVRELGASVFVDDNPVFCDEVAKDPSVRVICFGTLPLSDRMAEFSHPHSLLSGDERAARGLPLPFAPTPVRENLLRVRTWPEVLQLEGM